jgi:hypothetical protein
MAISAQRIEKAKIANLELPENGFHCHKAGPALGSFSKGKGATTMDLPQLDIQQRGRCLADLFESHLRGTYPNVSVTHSRKPEGPFYRFEVSYGPNLSRGVAFTDPQAGALGNNVGKWISEFDRRCAAFLEAQ